ncbi:MAG: acetyl-CoA carboxylase biotin carboxyl carrier protein subunit [Bacteroidales bacterium]|jgi:biotin carboxyl carrier protein|nr:acetyl-CoA carboxylase biotin carboxyl carrier protein subunit [Bacteroidales bacterium]NLM93873.1 acetyl-CoA carboxylase biotin carboxyl carrier protein subunit [Bacteroidales bacterium]
MPYEVKLNNRIANVELLSRQDNKLLVSVDGKEFALDFVKISNVSYSVLYQNKSFNIELIPVNGGIKRFMVNTLKSTYDVEIIDAEAKYLASRKEGLEDDGERIISAPIPGKVVKVLARKDDLVVAGQTLVILSAMKMESEFKAKKAGKIVDVKVEEGQTVESRQPLLTIEYEETA